MNEKVLSTTYHAICDSIMNYLFPIIALRSALKNNNYDAMMAAGCAYRPMWFVRNHPVYRQLELHDLLDRLCYPPEILEHIKKTESLSVSGNDGQGESADFILETINKDIQKRSECLQTHKKSTGQKHVTTMKSWNR